MALGGGLDCGIIGRVTEKKEKKIYVLKNKENAAVAAD